MNKLQLNSIDDIIDAYRNDLINEKTLFHILQKCMPTRIAIFADEKGYTGTKEETLKSLEIYKSFAESGQEMPLFFFPANEDLNPNEDFNFSKMFKN